MPFRFDFARYAGYAQRERIWGNRPLSSAIRPRTRYAAARFHATARDSRHSVRLTLYQRDDCRLCEEAVGLLAAARTPEFASVWIDGDADLEARYGVRVPVLRDEDSGRELGWPFDAARLLAFLAG